MLICVRILSPLSEEPAAVSGLSRSACVSMSIYSIVHIHKSEKASIQICFCRYISSKSVFQLINPCQITLLDYFSHMSLYLYMHMYIHTRWGKRMPSLRLSCSKRAFWSVASWFPHYIVALLSCWWARSSFSGRTMISRSLNKLESTTSRRMSSQQTARSVTRRTYSSS